VESVGYKLEVLRDRPAAGLIDNYLRSRLRLCKFVIADLTHANNGAYWEAGFAEGLGKPVIYTCERGVFDVNKTHFDTNHSQTVVWHSDDAQEAHKQLVACIQNTFPDSR
jgi:nucleoside 2-deoxyribosyltransferase